MKSSAISTLFKALCDIIAINARDTLRERRLRELESRYVVI